MKQQQLRGKISPAEVRQSTMDSMAAAALNPFPFSRACHKQKHTDVVFMFSVVFFFRY